MVVLSHGPALLRLGSVQCTNRAAAGRTEAPPGGGGGSLVPHSTLSFITSSYSIWPVLVGRLSLVALCKAALTCGKENTTATAQIAQGISWENPRVLEK